MLSKLKFIAHLKSMEKMYCNSLNRFRAVENHAIPHEIVDEKFKYKSTLSYNSLSHTTNVDANTTAATATEIEFLKSSDIISQLAKMNSEVSRDRLGQWPMESESELSGQGLLRLKNGRFNKVSENFKVKQNNEKIKQSELLPCNYLKGL